MEKEKYYTPSIEEFNVGFEYYMPILKETDNGYLESELLLHTWTANCQMSNLFNVDYNGNNVRSISVPECLKVKYLDREDIESLGFLKDSGDCDYVNGDHGQLEIIHEDERGMLIKIDTGYGACMEFYGRLKNKSELKKALKQLGL